MKIDLNNPAEFTIDGVRRMIASGNDKTHTQIRVTKNGVAFISTTIGSEDTNDLAFRFETFSAGSDQVGIAAAQDEKWVQKFYDLLKSNWPNPKSEYIDDF